MDIDIRCPACHRRVSIPEGFLGKRIKCPRCQQYVLAWDEEEMGEPPPGEEDEDKDEREEIDKEELRRRKKVRKKARQIVDGPATALIITGWLNGLSYVLGSAAILVGLPVPVVGTDEPVALTGGILALAIIIVVVLTGVFGVLVVIGGQQMRRLKSYGLGLTAAILALIPVLSACFPIGTPVGIWAIIALNQPEVKEAIAGQY
jgi:hypothetical protein